MNKIYKSKWNAALGAWVACSELVSGRVKNLSAGVVTIAVTAPLLLVGGQVQAVDCTADATNGTFNLASGTECTVKAADVAPEIGNTSVGSNGFRVYSNGGVDRTMKVDGDITTTFKGQRGIILRSVVSAGSTVSSTFDASGKTINLTVENNDGRPAPVGDNVKKIGLEVSHSGTAKIGTLNLVMKNLPNGDSGGLGGRFEHYGVLAGSSVDAGELADYNGTYSRALFDNLNIDMQSVAQGGFFSKYPLLVGIRAIQGASGNSGNGSAGYVKVSENLKINLDATTNDAIGIYVSGSGNSGEYSQVHLNNSDITIKSSSDRANAIHLGKGANVGTGVGKLYSIGQMDIDTTAAPNSSAIEITWQGALLDANEDSSSTNIQAGGSALSISGNSSEPNPQTITSFNNLVASTTSTTADLIKVGTNQKDYQLNVRGAGSQLTAADNGYLLNVAGSNTSPSVTTFNFLEGTMSGLVNKTAASTLNINMDQGATWKLVEKTGGDKFISRFTKLTMQNGSMLNAFKGDGSATFELRGDVTSNASTISMSDGVAGDQLFIDGNYHGETAHLLVDSTWNNPDVQNTDVLMISGRATGTTQVSVPGGIIGDVTQGDIPKNGGWLSPVVSVWGDDPDGPNTFVGTAETTNAGQAQLAHRMNPNDGQSEYFWTLAAGSTPIYTPGTAGYVQMPRLNRELGFAQLGKLHERMGEQQTWAWDNCGTQCADYRERTAAGSRPHPFWGRIQVSNLKEQGKERLGYKTDSSLIQFGTDINVKTDEARNHRHIGVMASYSHGKHDFYDKNRAENGVVTSNKHTGSGSTDMYSIGAYSTWYQANGTYVDLVGNVSGIRNKYKSASGNASQSGYGLGASIEVGRPWKLGASQWQIEPQAQLSYQYVHLKGFDDDVREISGQSGGTLRGRLGARLAWNNDNGNQNTRTFYVTANVLHDFTGNKSKADIGRDGISEHYGRTWGEVAVGTQLALSKSTYLYGDVRYDRSLGGHSNAVYRGSSVAREGYSGRIGVRYSW